MLHNFGLVSTFETIKKNDEHIKRIQKFHISSQKRDVLNTKSLFSVFPA